MNIVKTDNSQNVEYTNGNVEKQADRQAYQSKETEQKFASEETEMHAIKNTPFNLLRDGETWYITLGVMQMDKGEKPEELIKKWKTPNWNTLLKMMLGVIEHDKKGLNK